ncbi:MAG: carboxypeptidase-like regulatory domain-containing protein, partial [Bacteroidaceae bacterium]|nr:carboxypeptidase-like regulatory domain-containing protein [Bacteroidaceae bacterium]
MKTRMVQSMRWLLLLSVFFGFTPVLAQESSVDYITISGVVKDKQNRNSLENVNISVPGSNIGTVTNADGEFILKIKDGARAKSVEFSHIGYFNNNFQLKGNHLSNLKIQMSPSANMLHEVVVMPEDPRLIVEAAIRKIPMNYSGQNCLLTGFYREMTQKGRHYINISEAVADIYKTPYKGSVYKDRVRILKGRRLLSEKRGDTLTVKLMGGPVMAVYLDVAKNSDFLFDKNDLLFYDFQMESSVYQDKALQYVISFRPHINSPIPYTGTLYIDKDRLSFTRAVIYLDMNDKEKVTKLILKKKPVRLRFKPLKLAYLITYKNQGGVTYLNYVRNDLRFKCSWKKKLFSTTYNITSEM